MAGDTVSTKWRVKFRACPFDARLTVPVCLIEATPADTGTVLIIEALPLRFSLTPEPTDLDPPPSGDVNQ
jgi:hypothetical protein